METKDPQGSGEDQEKEMASEKTGPSRRQFLAQSGRVAAGIGAASLLSNPGQSGLSFAANESLITKVGGTGGAKMKKVDAPQRTKEALAAAVKAELNAPIISAPSKVIPSKFRPTFLPYVFILSDSSLR